MGYHWHIIYIFHVVSRASSFYVGENIRKLHGITIPWSFRVLPICIFDGIVIQRNTHVGKNMTTPWNNNFMEFLYVFAHMDIPWKWIFHGISMWAKTHENSMKFFSKKFHGRFP